MTKFIALSSPCGGSSRMTQTSIKGFFERKLKEVNNGGNDFGIPLTPPAASAAAAVKKDTAAPDLADKENEDDDVIVITSDNDGDGDGKRSSSGIVGKKRKSAATEKVDYFNFFTSAITI